MSIPLRGPMVRAVLEGRKHSFRFPASWTLSKPFNPDDVVWVREPYSKRLAHRIRYEADERGINRPRHVPEIHMKKGDSRILLRIAYVNLIQLHDLERDHLSLKEEGFAELRHFIRYWDHLQRGDPASKWDKNPKVWQLRFVRLMPKEDAVSLPRKDCY